QQSHRAEFTTSSLAIGPHNITATYGGDNNYNSSSASTSITVDKGSSSITVTTTTPPVAGQSVTFKAKVEAVPPAVGFPGGNITYVLRNAQNVVVAQGTKTLDSSGIAFFSVTLPSSGQVTLDVTYSGDTTFQTSATH